jgi:hypothetical protein
MSYFLASSWRSASCLALTAFGFFFGRFDDPEVSEDAINEGNGDDGEVSISEDPTPTSTIACWVYEHHISQHYRRPLGAINLKPLQG